MILAVPTNTQSPSFDCGETQPDGFPESGRVDVRDTVLIANSSVGEVQALSGNVPIGIWSIVGGQPVIGGREDE